VRAIITGASGFVGCHLARHLTACGDELLCLERPATSQSGGQPVIRWDICEAPPPEVHAQVEAFAPEAIYHLAAISIPADCGQTEPTPLAEAVNVRGTGRVLALAETLKPMPRVLVVSSAYVYAPVDSKLPVVDENSPVAPRNAYGITKLAAEALSRTAAGRGVPAIVARAFNHTGPGQSDRLMLPEWCRRFAAGDDPVVVQCREAWLDLIDVRDVVRAYRLLIERGSPGETYNVGGGIARRSGDVLAELARIADPRRRIEEIDPVRRQQPIADISRLTAATGWRPEIDLRTTIAETYAYWQSVIASQNPAT
jgi:GDP-4-dehydro-6-deoxy-D-mannose reductase